MSSERQTPDTTVPSLDVLARDQRVLLYDGERDPEGRPPIRPLVEGFDSYWELLSWTQAACIRTLGHVPFVVGFENFQPTATLTDHLFGTSHRDRRVRQRLAERLGEACRNSARQLANHADERVEVEGESERYTGIDVSRERSPAMRPGLRELDKTQADALTRLWPGFETRAEVAKWCQSLSTATLALQPDRLHREVARAPALLNWLLADDDDEQAQIGRYRFAVGTLLPAFAYAARTFRPVETHEKERDENPWNEV